MKTDVLIVGAGPTGLMAANQLQRFGINFIIVDYKKGPTIESRALAVSARSMEIYQQLGLAQTIFKNSLQVKGFQIYSNGKKKAEINVLDIGKGLSDFSNMMTIFEQNKNETLLYQNLQTNGQEVEWETEFLSFSETENGIISKVKNQDKSYEIQSKYLIACDGAKSPVRHQLDVTFDGGTYENKFFVADIILDCPFGHDKLVVAPSDNVFSAFFPMEGEDRYRMVGTLPKAFENKENIEFDDVKDSVKTSLNLDIEYKSVNWFSIYKLHHRCVNKFSVGNVFLAGDAAHIHSPAGAQGMNTGLIDAHNLCWKLAFVINGHAKEKLLETFNEERLPFAQWVLSVTDRGFSFLSSSNWFAQKFRKYVMLNLIGYVFSMKFVPSKMFPILSQIWYSYKKNALSRSHTSQKLQFKAGDRLPYLYKNFYTEFRDTNFHLIHVNDQKLSEEVKNNYQELFPFLIKIVDYNLIDEWKKWNIQSELFILVRPDLHIAFIADKLEENQIKSYLKTYF